MVLGQVLGSVLGSGDSKLQNPKTPPKTENPKT
jgi:hypothetical protein